MKIGEAYAIIKQIDSDQYTDDEKGTAIMKIAQMPTHNGVTKKDLLKIVWYLLSFIFDLPEGTKKPTFEND